MTKILTTLAIVAAVTIPAFAANAQNGSNSYAMAQSQYSSALNGGGSEGYNQSEAQSVVNR